MKYLAFLVLLLVALAVPAASEAQAAGKYRLVEVAGAQLPAVIDRDKGCVEEVENATLTLEENGLWHVHATTRETCGAKVKNEVETDSGRWSMSGSTVTFVENDDDDDDDDGDDLDDMRTGTVSGNTLRVDIGGERYLVFQKE